MTSASAREVLDRRRAQQARWVDVATRFAEELHPGLVVRAVVIFGSVARGDFHDASDVDVLVVADHVPDTALARNAALGLAPNPVQVVAWTTAEWYRERERGNPIATECAERGIVVRGAIPTPDGS